ncbi:MAG TPA: NTP transferase domain-containing protein [Fastidiosipila sp.]|nr:NTP transferase domain-containing protein [Fastidiosipila sp.]
MAGTKVKHAVIMAAGISSRLAPLSFETPKALLEVKGEILIERQIGQLLTAGIEDIIVVTGYKAEMFDYLPEKFPVTLIHNAEYDTRNNNGSLYVAKDYLAQSYICSADNYFSINPFESQVDKAYYAVSYADGETDEWCVETDQDGYITGVTIGGRNEWYMLGHVFFDQTFADTFLDILLSNYERDDYRPLLWESIYLRHLDRLFMKTRQYQPGEIFEFDTLDDLRRFDPSYLNDSRSTILQQVAAEHGCLERDITDTAPLFDTAGRVNGFSYRLNGAHYHHLYGSER